MEFRFGITGHRPNKLPGGYLWDDPHNKALRSWLRKQIIEIKSEHEKVRACTGMALGTDIFFANICYWEKVPFVAFCPCWGQENKWPEESQDVYTRILKQANEIIYAHNGPYPGSQCMLQRNQLMIDWLTRGLHPILLAVWNGEQKGGTFDAICRAKTANINVIVLNPNNL